MTPDDKREGPVSGPLHASSPNTADDRQDADVLAILARYKTSPRGNAARNAAKVSCSRCGGLLTPQPSRPRWRHCAPCVLADARAGHAARRAARKGLGLTERAYRDLFGGSRERAEILLLLLADGSTPADLIAYARRRAEA